MKRFFCCIIGGILFNKQHFYEVIQEDEEYRAHRIKCVCCGHETNIDPYAGIGG
jgi:hypothetical protein